MELMIWDSAVEELEAVAAPTVYANDVLLHWYWYHENIQDYVY